MKVKERNQYLDVVKGIAIILVIIGHCIQYGYSSDYYASAGYFDNILFKTIYSFHMPMFAVLSGYLFYFTISRKDVISLLKNRIIGLGLPIITVGVISFCVKFRWGSYSLKGTVSLFFYSCLGSLWFVLALLYCSLIFILLKVIFKKVSLIAIIVPIPLFFVIPDTFNLHYMKYLYLFFAVGYLWNVCGGAYKINTRQLKFVLVGSGIIMIPLVMKIDTNVFVYQASYWLLNSTGQIKIIYYAMYRWIIGAVGCVFIYSAIYLLMPYLGRYRKVISILTSLGTTSLGIYIFQRIIIELFLLDFIKKQNFFIPWYGMILEIFIVTVVCWTLTKLTQKNRILKLLLLGGR